MSVDEDLERSADGWDAAAKSWQIMEIGLWILSALAAVSLIVFVVSNAIPPWFTVLVGLVLGYTCSRAITARRRRRSAIAQSNRLRSLVRSN